MDYHPDLADVFQRITASIQTVLKRLNGIDVAMLTYDLYIVSSEMASGYHRRKTDVGLMDYDDLIHQTIRLLQQDGGASWVRYKLDRGLKYLLIDEAQDTSPEQWQILTAIATEFFVDNTEDQGQRQSGPCFQLVTSNSRFIRFKAPGLNCFKTSASISKIYQAKPINLLPKCH